MAQSRRAFVSKAGKGIAFTSLALSPAGSFGTTVAPGLFQIPDADLQPVRIGIIGAENSHTAGFGRMFNVEKKFPGVEVLYVWGETDEFASRAAEQGSIPQIVKDPLEMMGKIDALIVDHRHPKYHLDAALPFVREGIPTFVDKPFCYRVEEGKSFLASARDRGTPVTSYSTIAHSDGTADMKVQADSLEGISQVVRFGPVDLDSPYGGVFFYGVHSVQPLMYIFGDDIVKVKVTREGGNGNATLVFASGLFATLVFKKTGRWETFVETGDGLVELKPRVEEQDPSRPYLDMVEMFRTGKEPRSYDSILACVAVLEALERSAATLQWESVLL